MTSDDFHQDFVSFKKLFRDFLIPLEKKFKSLDDVLAVLKRID